MITFIFISLATMSLILAWAWFEYYREYRRHNKYDLLRDRFNSRSETLHRRILKARTVNDCRRIQSNLIGLANDYHGKINKTVLESTLKKLWGYLDARTRLMMTYGEDTFMTPELSEITYEQLMTSL